MAETKVKTVLIPAKLDSAARVVARDLGIRRDDLVTFALMRALDSYHSEVRCERCDDWRSRAAELLFPGLGGE